LDPKVLRRKRERSVRLLKELIAIPSSNPHVSDKDEREIARFLREELENSGLEVKLQQVTSKPYWAYEGGRSRTRPNVIARTGTKGGRKLILNGHIDTVSGSTMKHPFEPRAEGDRLYGRGSADMKGGVAAIVAAAEAIQQSGRNLKGELVLSLVVDEETLGKGTIDFLKAEQGDFAIVAEPTQNTLASRKRAISTSTSTPKAILGMAKQRSPAHGRAPSLRQRTFATRYYLMIRSSGRDAAA